MKDWTKWTKLSPMKPTSVNIHAAKTNLSRLVERAAAGEEIVIAKAGKPIARLVPFRAPSAKKRIGALKGKIWISPDFDAPLPKNILRGFGIEE